jgi:anti-anti-sigma factor
VLQTSVALVTHKPKTGAAMPNTDFPDSTRIPSNRPRIASESERIVVWLSGDQDCVNAPEFMDACVANITSGEADLVIDLCYVEFMSAATVDVIAAVSEVLRGRNRRLTVRSPSRSSRRILEICSLSDLIEHSASASAAALATWVAVPKVERDGVGTVGVDVESSRSDPSAHPCAAKPAPTGLSTGMLNAGRDGS